MVLSAALPGFSHREQALIALVSRFHRKGSPSLMSLDDILEPSDLERVRVLSACLRLAEYLERSKAQRVQDLRCHLVEGYLQIVALASGDIYVELKEAKDRSGLLAEVFGVTVEIVQGH